MLLGNNVYTIFFCPASKVCSSNNLPHMVHSVCFEPSSVCVASRSTIQSLAIQSITGTIACGTTIVPQRVHFIPSVKPVSLQVGATASTATIFDESSCLQLTVLQATKHVKSTTINVRSIKAFFITLSLSRISPSASVMIL